MAKGGSGWRRDIDQPLQELVERGLPVVDRSTFVIGERNADQHPLEVLLGLQELALAGVF